MSVNYIDKSTGDLIRVAGGGNDVLYADSPIGSIIPFGGTTAPDGFLLCNGDQVSKTTYSELYAVIGDSFKGAKADPTSGNFYLPDLREVTLKGVGTNYAYAINNHGTIGNVGGFMEDRVQAHTHSNNAGRPEAGSVAWTMFATNYLDGTVETNNGAQGRFGATTEVKSVGVNYIIKATQVGAPADFMDAVDEAVEEALAVIDSPITKVGAAINGDRFWSKRTGNVVEIMIDGTTGSNIPCAQSVVVAKVPKNALTISDVCIEIDSKSLVSAPESGHKRAWVDSTGNVCVFIVMPDLAATYTGNIYIGGTYITTE